MSADQYTNLLTIIGLSSITGSLVGAAVNWVLEGRKFKREQNVTYVREKIDAFYSPMIFHFENMRSWSAVYGHKSGYVFAGESLGAKLEDMKALMRSGLRFVSPIVESLWYEWQPYAVAAVERLRGKDVYAWFNEEELQIRSQKLHRALRADCEKLMEEYKDISKSTEYQPPNESKQPLKPNEEDALPSVTKFIFPCYHW